MNIIYRLSCQEPYPVSEETDCITFFSSSLCSPKSWSRSSKGLLLQALVFASSVDIFFSRACSWHTTRSIDFRVTSNRFVVHLSEYTDPSPMLDAHVRPSQFPNISGALLRFQNIKILILDSHIFTASWNNFLKIQQASTVMYRTMPYPAKTYLYTKSSDTELFSCTDYTHYATLCTQATIFFS